MLAVLSKRNIRLKHQLTGYQNRQKLPRLGKIVYRIKCVQNYSWLYVDETGISWLHNSYCRNLYYVVTSRYRVKQGTLVRYLP